MVSKYVVFDIKAQSSSGLRSLSMHCKYRTPDGNSDIDPSRSHLNQRLYGHGYDIYDAIENWKKRLGVKGPAKQAETPYLTLVLSASPEFFRDDAGNTGKFTETAMEWVKSEYGHDVVFAELHLDETTPHIHVVIAPTYEKKPRVPGKQKKGETLEDFEARKEAARTAPGQLTMGRSSSRYAHPNSYENMRRSFTAAMSQYGLEYGEDRQVRPTSKADYLKSLQASLKDKEAELGRREADLAQREATYSAHGEYLRDLERQLTNLHASVADVKARIEVQLSEQGQQLARAFTEVEDALIDVDHARHKMMSNVMRFERMLGAMRTSIPLKIWQSLQQLIDDLKEALGITKEVVMSADDKLYKIRPVIKIGPSR